MATSQGGLPLFSASPWGEAPPKGGGEGQLHLPCKNFQTKGQFHFRLKSFRANQSRPSFASLSLGTFPPRGRLNFRRSSCFPLRGEWREAPREDMTGLDLFSRLSPTASPKGKPRITARNPEEKIISHESVAPLIRLAFARHLPPKGKALFPPHSRLPLGGRLRRKAVVRGSYICLAKNFQTKGQLHFRLKLFRANQSRPSFASLSLGTFPPRGRLNFCLFQGFPSGGGSAERRW